MQELDEIVNGHFGSGDAQTQSTNDEAELQEQLWQIMALFTKPIWSLPNPYWTTVRTKLGFVKTWSGPKRDLLMCKDHGPTEQTWICKRSLLIGHLVGKVRVASKMANRQRGANWSNDETWLIVRLWSL